MPPRGHTHPQGVVRVGVEVILWPVWPGDGQRDLLAYANRGVLPLGVVALDEHELCGVAALRAESIATHAHLAPWAAAGLVRPCLGR